MLQQNIVTKTLIVNFITRQGGGYGQDVNDEEFKVYIPKWVVNSENLRIKDVITCKVGPNYPKMADVCPHMVKSLNINPTQPSDNGMQIIDQTDEEPVSKRSGEIVDIAPLTIAVADEAKDISEVDDVDIQPHNLTDMTAAELDELIVHAFDELPRLTYAEVFWIISGYPKMKLREMSIVQRAGYDRVGVRCSHLHKHGALACAELRKSEASGISKRVYALKIDDL